MASRPDGSLDRVIDGLCRAAAALGGLAIFAIALTVFVSVFGRSFRLLSIPGDFEVVEIGSAAAVFLFFPICQLERAHITIELFTDWLPVSARRALEAAGELLFALAWAVLVWRLTVGGIEAHGYGDRSMILGMPTWIVYLPAVAALAIAGLVALQSARRLLAAAGRGARPS